MIFAVKVNNTSLDKILRRVVKVLGMGLVDVQLVQEAVPFGIDSNPLDKMVAILAETSKSGRPVIIGYLNKGQKAAKGEIRIFSKNADGEEQTYLWLKADGTIEIGGDANHMTQFEELKSGFDELKGDVNALVSAFNSHMHATAATGPPSPPTPGSGIPASPSTATIDAAKLDDIKTL